MNRFLGFIVLLFSLLFSAQQDVENTDERVISFHSDIVVNEKGGLQVSEHIKVYATGNTIRRGIFRTLPLSRNLNNKEQKVRYTDISVTKNGEQEDFHEETNNNNLMIYVGKEDVFLTPAVYDYVISYSTKDQIGFFPEYDEFYWNVNGLAWDFTTENISANIKLPNGTKIIQNACYTGQYGEKGQDCTFTKISDTEMSFFAKDFSPNEGLTVAVGFEKGLILPPPPPTFLEKYALLIGGILFLAGLFFYFFKSWNLYGRHNDTPTVYPQFNPPNELSPASFGYLKKERFDTSMVTASVVSLAVKGYIKITESEESKFLGISKQKVYTLTNLKSSSDTLPIEEQEILQKLFTAVGDSITLDDQYDSSIESMVKKVDSSLTYQHDKILNTGNNQKKLILPMLIFIGVYFLGLFLSYTINPEISGVIIGVFIFFVCVVVFFVTQYFGKFTAYSKFFWIIPVILVLLAIIISTKLLSSAEAENFAFSYILLVFGFAGFMIYSFLIRQPSPEKLEQKSLIDGFEMYLSAAENQLMQFHNPPQMTPEIFEKYLPYAMVLGVDKIWGKKFEKMLASMQTPYQNTWYAGNTFQTMAFASAFNSSMTNTLSSASTPPSSSGSGSGGGGFSGGGGGGGGGGGW